MVGILQYISAVASIISIPLAIYFSRQTTNTKNDKARLDIMKTLSYKLSTFNTLSCDDIKSVYNSKLREHKIKRADFGISDIINDLRTDVMSNAFLDYEKKNLFLEDLLSLLDQLKAKNKIKTSNKITKSEKVLYWLLVFIPIVLLVGSSIGFVIITVNYLKEIFFLNVSTQQNMKNIENIYQAIYLDKKLWFFVIVIIVSLFLLLVGAIRKYIKQREIVQIY